MSKLLTENKIKCINAIVTTYRNDYLNCNVLLCFDKRMDIFLLKTECFYSITVAKKAL